MGEEYRYLITNFHIVYSEKEASYAERTHIYLYGSESWPELDKESTKIQKPYKYDSYAIECSIAGSSVTHDIAVLVAKTADIMKINPNATAAEFADDYTVGESAVAIGNPNGDGLSVTGGIVSVKSEYIELDLDGTTRLYRSMRIDTPLYHGNSGGAVFNKHGKLIGIANAGDVGDQNVNYAIPLEIAKAAADNIIHYYEDGDEITKDAYKITIGVVVEAENTRFVYDENLGYGKILDDIMINEVVAGGKAESLGFAVGDRLVSVTLDGVTYVPDRYYSIHEIILMIRVGSKLSFTLMRAGETINTDVYTVKSDDLVVCE